MSHHIGAWEAITTDPNILQAVSGYRLEFDEGGPPTQQFIPHPYTLDVDEQQAVNEDITRLHNIAVIEQTLHEEGDFISNIFTRRKKYGRFRMILDLSYLNEHIQYHHFKMDTLETAIQLLRPNCFLASIDLKDAYYTVPIAAKHRKYLKFIWNDKLWQFRAMPNGLSSGPRIFTKLMKPPFSLIRSKGHSVVAYIDDTLFVAETEQAAKEAVADTTELLSRLGFAIHPLKSVMEPVQEITFLGFILNSNSMEIKLTEKRAHEIVQLCSQLLATNSPTIRLIATVAGKLVAAFPGVQYGQMHYRELEKIKQER